MVFYFDHSIFRWVCTSGKETDLEKTDELALDVLNEIVRGGVPKDIEQQYSDNIKWISEASKHRMVVGSQVKMFIMLIHTFHVFLKFNGLTNDNL